MKIEGTRTMAQGKYTLVKGQDCYALLHNA